jgi:uncharacterized protein
LEPSLTNILRYGRQPVPRRKARTLPTESINFTSPDGGRLEGRIALPDASHPGGGAVLCHPHPQYGGSMSSALIPALQRAFVAAGWAALRFNFRGVGRSEGSFGGGVGEVSDVLGALARVRQEVAAPTAVVGWSFGAIVGLNAVAGDGAVDAFVGIAPPARQAFAGTFELPEIAVLDRLSARALLVCGTEDPFCRPQDLERLAAQLPPPVEVRILEDADHFFREEVDELCKLVVDFVTTG